VTIVCVPPEPPALTARAARLLADLLVGLAEHDDAAPAKGGAINEISLSAGLGGSRGRE
jgi:hypothetical protein